MNALPNKSREENPPQKPPTPIKRVCANSFWGCSCKLSSIFPLIKQEARRKSLGKLFAHIVFSWFFLGWVVLGGGFLSLEETQIAVQLQDLKSMSLATPHEA